MLMTLNMLLVFILTQAELYSTSEYYYLLTATGVYCRYRQLHGIYGLLILLLKSFYFHQI